MGVKKDIKTPVKIHEKCKEKRVRTFQQARTNIKVPESHINH